MDAPCAGFASFSLLFSGVLSDCDEPPAELMAVSLDAIRVSESHSLFCLVFCLAMWLPKGCFAVSCTACGAVMHPSQVSSCTVSVDGVVKSGRAAETSCPSTISMASPLSTPVGPVL